MKSKLLLIIISVIALLSFGCPPNVADDDQDDDPQDENTETYEEPEVTITTETGGALGDIGEIMKVKYLDGQFFVLGALGIASSTDGEIWTTQTVPVTDNINDICFSGTIFMAVGDNGVALYSNDGISWTPAETGTNGFIAAVVWNGDTFLAVGAGGSVLRSADGASWTLAASGYDEHLYDVEWCGSEYVAVGDNACIITSPDGTTWTSQNLYASRILLDIAWNGIDRYIAVGGYEGELVYYYSADGHAWTRRESSRAPVTAIQWDGVRFIAVDYDGDFSSTTDGLSWTSRIDTYAYHLISVCSYDDKIIAVGTSSQIVDSDDDGESWYSVANHINGLAFLNNSFIAVGKYGHIMFSDSDGKNWSFRKSGTRYDLYDAAWDGTNYLVVGVNGIALSSPDGITWTNIGTNISTTFSDIIWDGSRFLAVNNGDLYTSEDGSIWTETNIDVITNFYGIEIIDGMYFLYGDTPCYSRDGENWNEAALDHSLEAVVPFQSEYIGIGESNSGSLLFYSSDDLMTWNETDFDIYNEDSSVYYFNAMTLAATPEHVFAFGGTTRDFILASKTGEKYWTDLEDYDAVNAVASNSEIILCAGFYATVRSIRDSEE
ncbi:MAG: hypothetical protein JW874_02845 [Spirochaetales bacterium]|nr:hypothetical protein [Spirochaetales bacterium]